MKLTRRKELRIESITINPNQIIIIVIKQIVEL